MTEKWGTGRVVAGGGVLYAVGLYVMSISQDPLTFNFSAGLLLGMAQSGCALGAILGAVGRALPESSRTFGLGIVTAAGAAGQCRPSRCAPASTRAAVGAWCVGTALLRTMTCFPKTEDGDRDQAQVRHASRLKTKYKASTDARKIERRKLEEE